MQCKYLMQCKIKVSREIERAFDCVKRCAICSTFLGYYVAQHIAKMLVLTLLLQIVGSLRLFKNASTWPLRLENTPNFLLSFP